MMVQGKSEGNFFMNGSKHIPVNLLAAELFFLF
jgi:hypothetical protein